jgi:hypothetical protein
LHRPKQLWRILAKERVAPLAVQVALLPFTDARLGAPRLLTVS